MTSRFLAQQNVKTGRTRAFRRRSTPETRLKAESVEAAWLSRHLGLGRLLLRLLLTPDS